MELNQTKYKSEDISDSIKLDEVFNINSSTASGKSDNLDLSSKTCETNLSSLADMKLEGWLKFAGVSLRKAGKQVWFVYGEDTGKLYYYIHPQDVMPAGEIDLKCSSLTFGANNTSKQGMFEIRSEGKIYSIDAQESAHKLSWLEALQKKRRSFSLKQNELAQDLLMGKKKSPSCSGLLNGESEETSQEPLVQYVKIHQVSTVQCVETHQESPVQYVETHQVSPVQCVETHQESPVQYVETHQVSPAQCVETHQESSVQYVETHQVSPAQCVETHQVSPAQFVENNQVSPDQRIETLQELVSIVINEMHSASADKKLNNDFSSKHVKDSIQLTSRPSPPNSLQLVNTFSEQYPGNSDELPIGSSNCEALIISHKSPKCADISNSHIDGCNQPDSSQTLSGVESKPSTSEFGFSPAANSPVSLSSNSPNGKLTFMSVLRNNFKIMKDSVKEKKANMSVKYLASTTPENTVNISSNCLLCRELGDELQCAKEKIRSTEAQLKADKLATELLREEMDKMKSVLNIRKEYGGMSEDDITQILQLKEKQITELETSNETLLDEKNMLTLSLRQHESELNDLKDQISMFQQMLTMKDEMIINLTNTNQELMDNNSNSDLSTDQHDINEVSLSHPSDSNCVMVNKKELERLKDLCKAYEDQNKFLTNEVIELNTLRQDDETREKLLKMHFDNLENKCHQVKSKYLYLLHEMQTPVRGGEENNNQDIINELLQEALETPETETENVDNDGDDDGENKRSSASFPK